MTQKGPALTVYVCLVWLVGLVVVPQASAQQPADQRAVQRAVQQAAQQAAPNQPLGERFVIEGAAGFWRPGAQMSVSIEGFEIIGSRIDFKRDLGLTDHQFTGLHATLKAGRKHKFRFQFIPLSYQQSARLERTIIFNGQRYDVGIDVASSFVWNAYRFGYEWDFLVKDWGFAGVLLEAKYTDVTAELQTLVLREYARVAAPIPAIGGIVRYYVVPSVSITGEVSGLNVPDVSDRYAGHFADIDIYGTVNFTRNVGAQLGYRSFDVGLLINQDSGSFLVRGLYFGVIARY